MNENANRLAIRLAALGKREREALSLEPAQAVLKLTQIAEVRCAVLAGIALHNRDKFGLTAETMALIGAAQ